MYGRTCVIKINYRYVTTAGNPGEEQQYAGCATESSRPLQIRRMPGRLPTDQIRLLLPQQDPGRDNSFDREPGTRRVLWRRAVPDMHGRET